jgi:GNAT superfamily N-acetyltransferase
MILREITTKRDISRFIRFPWKIYQNDPNWVPPLIVERRELLNPQKNPFFEHAEVKLYMAADEAGNELGRIAGIVNSNHIRTHKEKAGFFGLFECADNQAAADCLLDAAAGFLRSRGMETMRGPENLSVNDDIGLLIQGFDTPPMIMMPHNPVYYERLIESYGCRKAMDLFAYYGEFRTGRIAEQVAKGAEIVGRRQHSTIRPLRMNDFNAELERIHAVYSSAWEENWGAVAMTDREFRHLAESLKQVIDPDLCLIAEVRGEVAGFSLALPDLNQILIRLNGRLFPFGIFKFMYHKRKIDALRILTMGVLKKFRHRGIDSGLYYETYRQALAKGIWRGEMSWILENNTAMNRIVENLGFRIYKKYRLYDFSLLPS